MATEPTATATPVRVLYAGAVPARGPDPEDIEARDDRLTVDQHDEFDAARDRIERDEVDCVVASHTPDGFDGVGFLESLRQARPELPVVLVPETDDGSVARRAVAADVTAFVPATDADALEAVVTAINEHGQPASEAGRVPISDLSPTDERRLKERVLDEAPVGITISDATGPDNAIVYANGAFEEITGYPPADVMGRNHRLLQGPDTDPETVAEVAADIEAERETRFVIRNYRRDGEPFWNQVDVTPIRDDRGEVTHYVGFQTDVTEREQAKQQLAAERETLDRLLDRIEGLLDDVTETLVRASDRSEIERLVTDRFGSGDEYTTAWLGRYDTADRQVSITEWAGRDQIGEPPLALDGDQPDGRRQLATALDRGEGVHVTDTTGLPAPNGDEPCFLVPLHYRSATYGVLAVFGDADSGTDRERVLLEALGRSIGTSINDVLTKQSLATDTVLGVGVDLYDDCFLTDIARELDTQFEHEVLVSSTGDGEIRTVVSTDGVDAEAVVEAASAHSNVHAVELLVAGEDGCVVQFRVADWPLVDLLSEFGARLEAVSADSQRLHVEFRAGTESTARGAVDALREQYDGVELVAYHEEQPKQTARGFRESVHEALTERQLTALQKAYVSGFFEWPRAVEGQQLADSMDIVPSTFHQHLQAAERKVFGALFEESATHR